MSDALQDVVIVGGGLVGGLCALLLAEGGVPVTLLDAAPPPSASLLAQRDARVWALSPANISLLERVGVWARVSRHAAYTGMQVWNREHRGVLRFGQDDPAIPDQVSDQWLGSMVEPSVLALALHAQLLAQPLIRLQHDCRVQQIEWYSQYWQVVLATGDVLNTRLLIGADGANSLVRRCAGIGVKTLDYRQTALTCAIRTEQPHQGIARQVFLRGGPLAFLPMCELPNEPVTGTWQSVVWSLPTVDAGDLAAADDATLMQALSAASGYVLGDVIALQSRGQFPLRAQQAERYVMQGLALIGDAAHVVHPMAGQGVNLGLLDAAVLADALLHDRARGLWAHLQTLDRYAARRSIPNQLMMHGLSALGWLQSTAHPAVMWGRGEGMHWLEQHPNLLDRFNQQASGWPDLRQTRYSAAKNALPS
ncbi:MAG: FAD-dependent monooxygenase [Pseudomonadota bacterium]|nr:FAD-dependent monooxygenase [Pseudomonadota bacterium]